MQGRGKIASFSDSFTINMQKTGTPPATPTGRPRKTRPISGMGCVPVTKVRWYEKRPRFATGVALSHSRLKPSAIVEFAGGGREAPAPGPKQLYCEAHRSGRPKATESGEVGRLDPGGRVVPASRKTDTQQSLGSLAPNDGLRGQSLGSHYFGGPGYRLFAWHCQGGLRGRIAAPSKLLGSRGVTNSGEISILMRNVR